MNINRQQAAANPQTNLLVCMYAAFVQVKSACPTIHVLWVFF